MTAVCVDDDALMLAQTVSCCRAHRLLTDVQAFTSSPEALAWLKDHPADLALLDINMPDMNGLPPPPSADCRYFHHGLPSVRTGGLCGASLRLSAQAL